LQVAHLLYLAARTHLSRPREIILTAAGFVLAVCVTSILFSVPEGLRNAAAKTGRSDVAIAMSASSFDEASSSISAQQVQLLASLPAVDRRSGGEANIAPQFIGTAKAVSRDGTHLIQVRGVDERTADVLGIPQSQLQAIGVGSRLMLPGAALPSVDTAQDFLITVRRTGWPLGTARAQSGGLWDSEYWAPASTLQAEYQTPSDWSVVWIKINDGASFDQLVIEAKNDPRLRGGWFVREDVYYVLHTQWLAVLLDKAALLVSIVLAVSAALVIANAMTASFRARGRELATLRALGFSDLKIFTSAILETLFVGVLAGAAGLYLVKLFLDGRQFTASAAGSAIFTRLDISSNVMVEAMFCTVAIGMASAVIPAARCAFGSIVQALKS